MTVRKILFTLLTTLFSTAFITACGDLGYEPNDSEEVSATLIKDEVNNDVPSEISQPDENDETFYDAETDTTYQVNPNRKVFEDGDTKGTYAHDAGIFYDWSRKVKTRTWYCITGYAQHNQNVYCSVGSGYVAIGGGAEALSGEPGALLTESRPSTNLNGWFGSSKDHRYPYSHKLYVYVIGLRLDGIPASTLKSKLHVYWKTSSYTNHPSTEVGVGRYKLIGGGARVNWGGGYGNLLVYSYPDFQRGVWKVKSKDHMKSSRASITAYSIGIDPGYISGFGWMETRINQRTAGHVNTGPSAVWVYRSSGWVLACPGAKSEYDSSYTGRLLTSIRPSNDDIYVRSKDHGVVDGGQVKGYALLIRKKP